MATLVQRIELADGIPSIQVPPPYSRVTALVTLFGVPLGDLTIKTYGGTVSSYYIRDQIAERFSDRIVQLWLERKMNSGDKASSEDLPAVDIVVCTSDRPEDLERCLRSLSEAVYHHKTTIVVDNGSKCDETRGIALDRGARYVREEKRGLDFARNAGLREAQADFVAFADDDVVVDRMWLNSIVRAFKDDEAVACVTGLTMPFELETEAQELFERYSTGGMRRGYERKVFDRFNLPPPAAGKVGAGANMAFRTAVLRQLGGFDEALDCGTPAKAGGDTDMFYRILRHGYKVCYEPRAIAWHRHRRGMDELQNQLAGYSAAVYAFLTKCLVEHHDFGALSVGGSWFKGHHLRNLALGMTGRGPQPWSMTLGELLGAFSGPIAYLKAKSYVSRIRLQRGLERRGRLNRSMQEPERNGSFPRLVSAILARRAGEVKRQESAQRHSTHT
ncbi:MAG TPA: glycosyltransferase family 2 protein [Armatimonadota bacterium]|nr:glycosyltransferase family 2 protein [Armatimonadota bacterium]